MTPDPQPEHPQPWQMSEAQIDKLLAAIYNAREAPVVYREVVEIAVAVGGIVKPCEENHHPSCSGRHACIGEPTRSALVYREPDESEAEPGERVHARPSDLADRLADLVRARDEGRSSEVWVGYVPDDVFELIREAASALREQR